MELVSVIVPVYNVEKYIDKCVSSILGQSYTNLEVILVDDGATDSCPDKCDAWALKDERIKVVHKKNGGLSDARNAGMSIAKGEYIAFVDSDDWLEQNFIQVLYEAILRNQCDVAECGVVFIGEDDVIQRMRCCESNAVLANDEALKRLVLEDGVYQTVWNKLYRAALIKELLFEKGKCHEDEFWTYQVFEKMNRMVILSDPLYFYLQRKQSIMGKGYSLKRLDGLEARYGRMKALEVSANLKEIVQSKIWFDYLYHYQCVLTYLDDEEQRQAIKVINSYMESTLRPRKMPREYAMKQKIWIWMFQRAPMATASIRNILKIGF